MIYSFVVKSHVFLHCVNKYILNELTKKVNERIFVVLVLNTLNGSIKRKPKMKDWYNTCDISQLNWNDHV